jgi:hypothetical protein
MNFALVHGAKMGNCDNRVIHGLPLSFAKVGPGRCQSVETFPHKAAPGIVAALNVPSGTITEKLKLASAYGFGLHISACKGVRGKVPGFGFEFVDVHGSPLTIG